MVDYDQGGHPQRTARVDLGPSVGWAECPYRSLLQILMAGTYRIDAAINLVTVDTQRRWSFLFCLARRCRWLARWLSQGRGSVQQFRLLMLGDLPGRSLSRSNPSQALKA